MNRRSPLTVLLVLLALSAGCIDRERTNPFDPGNPDTEGVPSLLDARADVLADKLVSFAAGYGLRAYKDGAYPGWTPDPSSPLLALCQRVYEKQFGAPASLQVIHAGLECGLLAASHPQLDMISFGPDIRGAHAPGERVQVESVARCWELLQAVLRALAKPAD